MKAIARRIASNRIVGIPATYFLRGIGADRLGRRVSYLCEYVPSIVPIVIDKAHKYRMYRGPLGQMDQGSATVWLTGWRSFERPLPDMFAAFAKDAQVVFDIGANVGFYSLVSTTVSPVAVVHAFEPFPLAQERLEANLRLNQAERRVQICRKAMSNESGVAKLFVPLKSATLIEASCSLNPQFRPQHSEVIEVPVTTLDEYVREQQLKRLDLIKLDVESHEHRVIQGGLETLRTLRPVIFLEVLAAADHAALEQLRKQLDYRSIQMKKDELIEMAGLEYNETSKNQILCPRERIHEVRGKAEQLGLGFKAAGTGV